MSMAKAYDRAKEVEEFDRSKAGVKGLLDSGISSVPRFFVHPAENLTNGGSTTQVDYPIIDFGVEESTRGVSVVDKIRQACETWGFFQVVNHGIPLTSMQELLQGIRRFHEQPTTEKMSLYTRDFEKPVKFYSNGDLLVSTAANWRDSMSCKFSDGDLNPDELPSVCREAISNYMKGMLRLKEKLAELLSKALGLDEDYLARIECMGTANLVCHYYPACPEPHLTLGATKHSDPSFLTVLLQDNIGGLQVFHRNQWIDVCPRDGTLVVHIGDLMQLITNGKFRSVEHRVRLRQNCPRVSAACFFYPSSKKRYEQYRPIEDFLSTENPPLYRGTTVTEYLGYYRSKAQDGRSSLPHFEL